MRVIWGRWMDRSGRCETSWGPRLPRSHPVMTRSVSLGSDLWGELLLEARMVRAGVGWPTSHAHECVCVCVCVHWRGSHSILIRE
jgi:hypothetical protein